MTIVTDYAKNRQKSFTILKLYIPLQREKDIDIRWLF